jgi:hypothetical protein
MMFTPDASAEFDTYRDGAGTCLGGYEAESGVWGATWRRCSVGVEVDAYPAGIPD